MSLLAALTIAAEFAPFLAGLAWTFRGAAYERVNSETVFHHVKG